MSTEHFSPGFWRAGGSGKIRDPVLISQWRFAWECGILKAGGGKLEGKTLSAECSGRRKEDARLIPRYAERIPAAYSVVHCSDACMVRTLRTPARLAYCSARSASGAPPAYGLHSAAYRLSFNNELEPPEIRSGNSAYPQARPQQLCGMDVHAKWKNHVHRLECRLPAFLSIPE